MNKDNLGNSNFFEYPLTSMTHNYSYQNINFIDMTDKLNTFILNKFNELNENILYKMNNNKIEIPRIHRIFICECKINSDIYLKYYSFHL